MTGQPMTPNSHAGWIDTHVHMDDARFADAQAVRRAARAEGVARLVIPAIGPVNFHTVRDLAQEWGDAYALGIHPMYLPHDVDAALAALEAALRSSHPYKLPAIVALPVVQALPAFADWVITEVNCPVVIE